VVFHKKRKDGRKFDFIGGQWYYVIVNKEEQEMTNAILFTKDELEHLGVVLADLERIYPSGGTWQRVCASLRGRYSVQSMNPTMRIRNGNKVSYVVVMKDKDQWDLRAVLSGYLGDPEFVDKVLRVV